ncbi:hypothetical protein HK405_004954, partial [Cladochytrium tenue]
MAPPPDKHEASGGKRNVKSAEQRKAAGPDAAAGANAGGAPVAKTGTFIFADGSRY